MIPVTKHRKEQKRRKKDNNYNKINQKQINGLSSWPYLMSYFKMSEIIINTKHMYYIVQILSKNT